MKKKLSDKDWLEKFYPVAPSPEMTWEQAVDHTLLKWSGAKKEVLQEYGCKNIDGTIVNRHNDGILFFGKLSCSLCVKSDNANCILCPLFHVRNEFSCTKCNQHEKKSPYDYFIEDGNVTKMLYWLRKTKAFLKTPQWKRIQKKSTAN